MGSCGSQDELDLFLKTSRAEEEDHPGMSRQHKEASVEQLPMGYLHQCMGKSNFGSINGTVSCALKNRKNVCIFGIEDDAFQRLLERAHAARTDLGIVIIG
jgi:hypothetical protein